jgi:uncharacterized HAD superfamily protein
MPSRKLRLAFDLDGVIINKPLFVPKALVETLFKGSSKKLHYRFPKSRLEQLIRRLSHFYVFRPPISKNISLIKKIKKQTPHQLFLVSSRYSFLKRQTQIWFEKRKIVALFDKIWLNTKDESPPLFKEKILRRLKPDYFFEDDPEIASFLSKKLPQTKVLLMPKAKKILQSLR